jgi:2-polyprenyl-3-methyl-5-hydroxy-6-metoxy-1,4-benzoquinol methylase
MNEAEQSTVTSAAADQQAFYDEMWRNYSHLDAVSPAAFHRRRLVVRLATQFASGARNILDVGCGQGELLREVAEAIPGAEVHGADLSEQSIVDSRKRNPTYDLFQLDLTAPDFSTRYASKLGAFEFVVCSEVLEHIPDDGLAATHLFSLVREGGIAIVTVPGGKMSAFDKVIGHQRHYTPASLEARLTQAGFQMERVVAWGFPFHSFYRTAVRVASGMTVPKGPKAAPKAESAERKSSVSNVLGAAYTLFGKALKPLFYLNAPIWGEQLVAVARRKS